MQRDRTQNILIVDDEKSNIDILLDIFEKINQDDQYNIITTISPTVALKTIQQRKIDLLLLDIMIPQIDGFHICQTIKRDPLTKHIPVVFITSKEDEESLQKAFEVGGADYITKPFKPKELIARVKNQLQLQFLKEKEMQYSKNVALHDLIQNIAHHWRQPLSVISSTTSGIMMLQEMGTLSDEKFYEGCNAVVQTTDYLSNIIENFKKLHESCHNCICEEFGLKDFFDHHHTLLFLDLKEIRIVQNIPQDIHITSSINELFQVTLAILKNSQDAFGENSLQRKMIFIEAFQEDDMVQISIYDNGGGVDPKNLPRLFEPYFTTKHKSQGRGLGLYSVKKIIHQTLKGDIHIENYHFEHDGEKMVGAKTIIQLPIKISCTQ